MIIREENMWTMILTEDFEVTTTSSISKLSVVSMSDVGVFIEGTSKFNGIKSKPIPLLKGEAFNIVNADKPKHFWVRIAKGSEAKISIEF